MLGPVLIAALTVGLMVTASPSGATPAEPGQKGLDLEGDAADDLSGRSVALSADGNTVAIGAPGDGARGRVRVFRWSGSAWVQVGTDIDGEAAGDGSGWSVALSADGNTVAIGAPFNSGSGSSAGHVRVYRWDDGTDAWVRVGADIDGEAAGDGSGWSVALSADGNTVAIGAPFNSNGGTSMDAGHVRVYRWDDGTDAWVRVGADIDGEAAGDESGASVALSADGNTVAIGALYNDGPGDPGDPDDPDDPDDVDYGHVRVYRLGGSGWVQVGTDIDGEAADDRSGFSVALSADGDTVAIGAPGVGAPGRVRVYRLGGSGWVQVGTHIDGEDAGAGSGRSVALSADGDTVAIGAPGAAPGRVRVYQWGGSAWVQRGSDIDGDAGAGSGYSVALSADGNTVAIGAPFHEARAGLAESAGYVRVYAFAVLEDVVAPPVVDALVVAVPPTVSCVPLAPAVGTTMTCTVSGGDPGIGILWRAAYNPVIAEAGVTLDDAGVGEFSFVVPAAALGQALTVELVAWAEPMSLGVVGGPVPATVPAGEGGVPAAVWSLVLAALVAFGLLRRGMRAEG